MKLFTLGRWALIGAVILVFSGISPAAEENTTSEGSGGPRLLIPYDVSAYEREPSLRAAIDKPWKIEELRSCLAERVAAEKAKRELHVYYYRIGYVLAFPLPLTDRPEDARLPEGIPGMKYPWTTWLAWELEERWRTLFAGWRLLGDTQAGEILQRELAALVRWKDFRHSDGSVNLVTAHLAAALALALADQTGWAPDRYRQAYEASQRLLEQDVRPWLEMTWPEDRTVVPSRLHNIPVVALVRSAQLARVTGSPLLTTLDTRARQVVQAWWIFRMGAEKHTEGPAYDGLIADAVTEWIANSRDRETLLRSGEQAFRSMLEEWIDLGLPGRVDIHAPLGDVEPEMPFWLNALVRLESCYRIPEARWLVRRYPIRRMPIAALAELYGSEKVERDEAVPSIGPRQHRSSVTLRSAWGRQGMMVAVGWPRCAMGHLHLDAGHIILGWQGRFWITDPGYQQYRPGEEREYTIGVSAHNAPIIAGTSLVRRAAELRCLGADSHGRQFVSLDLTPAYDKLPRGASVERSVWLIPGEHPAVVVRDRLVGFPPGTEVHVHWLGGGYLAWAFVGGWARLSDGQSALWLGTIPQGVEAGSLTRHPGSRGPLNLIDRSTTAERESVRWWVFQSAEAGHWSPPVLTLEESGILSCRLDGEQRVLWSLP